MSKFRNNKPLLVFLLCILGMLTAAFGPTLVDLVSQVTGTLGSNHGGTGNTSNGNNGQVLIGDGAGHFTPQDPIVSYNYVNLMNAQTATAQVTGSAVRVSTFSGFGTLYLTFASITGSPSGCTLQLKSYDSLGNSLNNGGTVSVTPANGTTTINFASASGLYMEAQISATYNCSTTFPTAGTISLDYIPGFAVGVVNFPATQAISAASLPLPSNAVQETGGNLATLAGGVSSSVYQENIKQIGGTAVVADPCQANAKSYVSVNQTANAQLVAGTVSKKIYPCSIHIVTATAQNIALVEGTGTTCATGTAGVGGFGGSTAATGWNFAANGGLTYGNGASALGQEGTAADNLCLFQSGTGQVSGGLSYVVQ